VIIHQREMKLPPIQGGRDILGHVARAVVERLPPGAVPLRLAIPRSGYDSYDCEVASIEGLEDPWRGAPESIFQFNRRDTENPEAFTVVLLVPTGIGAEIGGHAGDAGPVARHLAAVCDRLITHPNVVNASDINEMPANSLYVEGSVICRLLMGTVALQPVRSNRLLVVLDAHDDEAFVNAAINAVSAARASYGLNCVRVVVLDPPIKLVAHYTSAGSAVGSVEGLDRVCRVLDMYRREFDAVAISSVIDVPPEFHMQYFLSEGRMVNPWGGVEAVLTHAISSLYDVPSAHSPMFESEEIADLDPGVVDPRMAAEAVSFTFLQCILKGLQRSPRILAGAGPKPFPGTISASDISCLVIPAGCLGLPTLAALEQGIPVIAVRENQNLMQNDLADLPWQADKFYLVENYWEAVGVIAALKTGIAPGSTRRPLLGTNVGRVALRERMVESTPPSLSEVERP
jgi:hypothetical protein